MREKIRGNSVRGTVENDLRRRVGHDSMPGRANIPVRAQGEDKTLDSHGPAAGEIVGSHPGPFTSAERSSAVKNEKEVNGSVSLSRKS